jgi:hypothetical protein
MTIVKSDNCQKGQPSKGTPKATALNGTSLCRYERVAMKGTRRNSTLFGEAFGWNLATRRHKKIIPKTPFCWFLWFFAPLRGKKQMLDLQGDSILDIMATCALS